MKKYSIYFFLLYSITLFSQNDKVDRLIIDTLKKSKDTLSIVALKNSIGKEYKSYQKYFGYIPSINPLNPKKLKRFSSKFGRRFHPIAGKYKQHFGLDISSKVGTPIHSAANGVVLSTIKSNKGCGYSVTIQHLYDFKTKYCHMYTFIVKKGKRVKKGDVIGFVGSTGNSTGPHLHYEIIKNEQRLDPYPFCFLSL